MGSYNYGKEEVCEWIRKKFSIKSTILDVGACDSRWRKLLPEYENMDAVEVFSPYIKRLIGYRNVQNVDIRDFRYEWYDLIIFGDVIEHLPVEDAKSVLKYAKERCKDMIISVPFKYKQGIVNGNVHEIHIQDDLTPELFDERYEGFETLCAPNELYRYYHKRRD